MKIAITHTATSGNITCVASTESATAVVNGSAGAWSPNASTWYDVVYTWDGTSSANAFKVYVDGVLLGSLTPSGTFSASLTNEWFQAIELGDGFSGIYQNAMAYDEIVIWDTAIDPTSVALVSGTGSLNGASRTSLVDVASFDGQSNSDPGEANVTSGTNYTIAGVSKTGTYSCSTDFPDEADVRNGVDYDNGNLTGSLDLPAVGDVRAGVSFDGATKTGTLDTNPGLFQVDLSDDAITVQVGE